MPTNDSDHSTEKQLFPRSLSRRGFLAGAAAAGVLGAYGWKAGAAYASTGADGESFLTADQMLTEVSSGVFAPVSYTSGLTLDGDFAKWRSYSGIVLPADDAQNNVSGWAGAADLSAEVHFAYDADNFYLGALVTDDVHHAIGDGNSWQGDGLQFAFGDVVNTASHTEYGVALVDGKADVDRFTDGMATSLPNTVETRFTQSDNDILYELRIPWTAAMAAAPPVGARVPFTMLVNDNDGDGRKGWIEWTPGIGNTKDVGLFARCELLAQGTAWTSWLAGTARVDSGTAVQFALYVPNFGSSAKALTIDVPTAGVAGRQVSIPAGQTLKKTFTVTVDQTQDVTATVTDPSTETARTETYHVVAVKSAAELTAMFDDLQKTVLPALTAKLGRVAAAGMSTDYETVHGTVIERFIGYGREDIDHDRRDRAEYIANSLYELDKQAETSLDAYLAGTANPPAVPRYKTGRTRLDGYSLLGTTTSETNRPILFTGYGMFGQVKQDVANFPDFGTNLVDYNLGPSSVIKQPAPFPHWFTYAGVATTSFTLDTATKHSGSYALKYTNASGTGYVVQGFATEQNTSYDVSVWVKGQDVGHAVIVSKDYGFSHTLPTGTFDWQQVSFTLSSDDFTSLDFRLLQDSSGTVWIDDAVVTKAGTTANLLQNAGFEDGPNTADFDVDPSSIKSQVAPMLADGELHNVAINFDLAIHDWPTWTYTKWRDIRNPDNLFVNKFDIEHPIVIEIVQGYIDAVMPLMKDSPALQSVTLSSEPIYLKNSGAYHLAHWRTWLSQQFGSLAQMNALYGTSYSGFDAVPVPDVEKVTGSPLYYDYLTFKAGRFTAFHQMLADRVHQHAPDLPVHIKPMGWGLLNRAPLLTYGVDLEAFDRLSDISGDDDSNAEEAGPQGYLNYLSLYDMQASMKRQPVFNSEDHVITDGDERYIPQIAQSVGNSIWAGALHGRTLSTIWVWERSYDVAGKAYLQGSILNRPDAVASVGRVSLDLNRLAREVTSFQNAPARVGILYSFIPNLYSEAYFSTLQRAYGALSYTGQKVGFVTDRQIADSGLDSYRMLVLPETTHVAAGTLREIKKWTSRGGTVVTIGAAKTLLTRDEHDRPLSRGDRLAVLHRPSTTQMPSNPTQAELRDVFFQQLDRLGISEPIVYDAATSQPVDEMEWRCARHDRKTLLSLINFSEVDRTVYLKSGRGRIVPVKELITDTPNASKTLTIPALTHHLYVIR